MPNNEASILSLVTLAFLLPSDIDSLRVHFSLKYKVSTSVETTQPQLEVERTQKPLQSTLTHVT